MGYLGTDDSTRIQRWINCPGKLLILRAVTDSVIRMSDSWDESFWHLVGKYFFHGMLYSVISLGLSYVLVFVIAGLVVVGLWIGLIIGLVLLMLVLGAINVFLMFFLWDISVKADMLSLFFHGLLLTVAFLLVSIPVFIANMFIPGIVTTIVLFILYYFIDGIVAESVASVWEEGNEDGGEDETDVRLTLR
jgi:hypothetical protein